MNRIIYSKQAKKSLDKYNYEISSRIINAINKIPEGDIKRLSGKNIPPLFRLRVGKYRIVYMYENDETIKIVKVDTRGDIYKD